MYAVKLIHFPDMFFPEDIEEYFHQGLLSQPQPSRTCTNQIIPDPSKVLLSCGRAMQTEKLQIVPGMHASDVTQDINFSCNV